MDRKLERVQCPPKFVDTQILTSNGCQFKVIGGMPVASAAAPNR